MTGKKLTPRSVLGPLRGRNEKQRQDDDDDNDDDRILQYSFSGAIYSKPQDTCSLQTYVHHYSWLQFASLALSLSETLQERRGIGI